MRRSPPRAAARTRQPRRRRTPAPKPRRRHRPPGERTRPRRRSWAGSKAKVRHRRSRVGRAAPGNPAAAATRPARRVRRPCEGGSRTPPRPTPLGPPRTSTRRRRLQAVPAPAAVHPRVIREMVPAQRPPRLPVRPRAPGTVRPPRPVPPPDPRDSRLRRTRQAKRAGRERPRQARHRGRRAADFNRDPLARPVNKGAVGRRRGRPVQPRRMPPGSRAGQEPPQAQPRHAKEPPDSRAAPPTRAQVVEALVARPPHTPQADQLTRWHLPRTPAHPAKAHQRRPGPDRRARRA